MESVPFVSKNEEERKLEVASSCFCLDTSMTLLQSEQFVPKIKLNKLLQNANSPAST